MLTRVVTLRSCGAARVVLTPFVETPKRTAAGLEREADALLRFLEPAAKTYEVVTESR